MFLHFLIKLAKGCQALCKLTVHYQYKRILFLLAVILPTTHDYIRRNKI